MIVGGVKRTIQAKAPELPKECCCDTFPGFPLSGGNFDDRFRSSARWSFGLGGATACCGGRNWPVDQHPKEWGQGWGAYGQRYESNLAYNAVRGGIAYGTSIRSHEDTRHFASQRQGFWGRATYALLSAFTAARGWKAGVFDREYDGVIGASAIPSTWSPESWKGAGNFAGNAGISFAITARLNLIREFLPDLRGRRNSAHLPTVLPVAVKRTNPDPRPSHRQCRGRPTERTSSRLRRLHERHLERS